MEKKPTKRCDKRITKERRREKREKKGKTNAMSAFKTTKAFNNNKKAQKCQQMRDYGQGALPTGSVDEHAVRGTNCSN